MNTNLCIWEYKNILLNNSLIKKRNGESQKYFVMIVKIIHAKIVGCNECGSGKKSYRLTYMEKGKN